MPIIFPEFLRKQKGLHLENIEKCGKCKNFSSRRSLVFMLEYDLKRSDYMAALRADKKNYKKADNKKEE